MPIGLREYLRPLALILLGLAILLISPLFAYATPPAAIRDSVAVCDPYYPSQCYSVSNKSAHIATATTTTVKSGAGSLVRVIVNKSATTSTATIYDNTAGSGTVLAILDTSAVGTFTYELHFSVGLTIVTSSTADLTVTYQ